MKSTMWRDIDLNFLPNPTTNDINIKTDDYAIKQSVENLLMTMFYERPFHPEIGSNVYKLLFEPMDAVTISVLKSNIINTITNFEPRVEVQSVAVSVDEDSNAIRVGLILKYVAFNQPLSFEVILYRSR